MINDLNVLYDKLKNAACLVVGDVMLDKYLFGDVSRISPEAPIPIVHIDKKKLVLGGAANVACNIRGFHVDTYLAGIIGNDVDGELLANQLQVKGIKYVGIVSDNRPTTVKSRVLGKNQQIVRIDEEVNNEISEDESNILINNIISIIDSVQVVVISDYNKGICTEEVCRNIIKTASEKGKFVVVDPKSNDWSKYAYADMITPNFKEFLEACNKDVKNEEIDICKFAYKLISNYNIKNILVTRSQYGMTIVNDLICKTYKALAREVYDVSGAGDTVVATLSSFMAVQNSIEVAVETANIAAGISVSKLGTYAVSIEEILNFSNMSCNKSISNADMLNNIVSSLKASNKKIVFTNGCFDVLHVGHIRYLNEAEKLGDALIIGINSDSSVKRLKGPKRPIVNQDDRMEMLANLSCVDYVVMFEEDTPAKLITSIMPDIIVKGGDYNEDDVVGKDIIEQYGGKVVIIPLVEGKSTTNIINKIIKNN